MQPTALFYSSLIGPFPPLLFVHGDLDYLEARKTKQQTTQGIHEFFSLACIASLGPGVVARCTQSVVPGCCAREPATHVTDSWQSGSQLGLFLARDLLGHYGAVVVYYTREEGL